MAFSFSRYDDKGRLKADGAAFSGNGLLDQLYGQNNQANFITATTNKAKEVIERDPAPSHYDCYSGKRYLVTGASGDIGSQVVRLLI